MIPVMNRFGPEWSISSHNNKSPFFKKNQTPFGPALQRLDMPMHI